MTCTGVCTSTCTADSICPPTPPRPGTLSWTAQSCKLFKVDSMPKKSEMTRTIDSRTCPQRSRTLAWTWCPSQRDLIKNCLGCDISCKHSPAKFFFLEIKMIKLWTFQWIVIDEISSFIFFMMSQFIKILNYRKKTEIQITNNFMTFDNSTLKKLYLQS